MKVRCILTGKPGVSVKPEDVPIKGKVYTIKEVVENSIALEGTENRTWYVLEEIPIMHHHSSIFEEYTEEPMYNIIERLKSKH